MEELKGSWKKRWKLKLNLQVSKYVIGLLVERAAHARKGGALIQKQVLTDVVADILTEGE